jgi:hypothetical protein
MQAQFMLSDLKGLITRVPAIVHTVSFLLEKPTVKRLKSSDTVIVETKNGRVLLKDKNGKLISSSIQKIS